jgi:hypothetical protein
LKQKRRKIYQQPKVKIYKRKPFVRINKRIIKIRDRYLKKYARLLKIKKKLQARIFNHIRTLKTKKYLTRLNIITYKKTKKRKSLLKNKLNIKKNKHSIKKNANYNTMQNLFSNKIIKAPIKTKIIMPLIAYKERLLITKINNKLPINTYKYNNLAKVFNYKTFYKNKTKLIKASTSKLMYVSMQKMFFGKC